MASLESHLAAQKSVNIPQLTYDGPQAPIADYVVNRTRSQSFAQGANIFTPNRGQKQIRFSLTTTAQGPFIDASSIQFRATINETGGTDPCQLLGPSWMACIEEVRVLWSGVEVERVTNYARTEMLLLQMESFDRKRQIFNEGLGFQTGVEQGGLFLPDEVPAGGSKVCFWKPRAVSLFKQHNYIPSAFLSSVVIELILNGDAGACANEASGHSTSYSLSDLRCYYDAVSVHDSYLSAMSSFLLQPSNRLTMHYQPLETTMYSVTARDQILTMPQSYSRLMNYIVTFAKTDQTGANAGKLINDFYLSPNANLRYFAQLGQERMPDLDIGPEGFAEEMYMRTMAALGVSDSSAHSVAISPAKYKNDSFYYIEDLEAIPSAHASGKSSMNASLLVHLFGLGTNSTDLPTHAFLTVQRDQYLSVSSGGVEVAS